MDELWLSELFSCLNTFIIKEGPLYAQIMHVRVSEVKHGDQLKF